MAKTLVLQGGKHKWMVVLRADHCINRKELKHLLGVPSVHLMSEKELEILFPGRAIGTMPPFGNLYRLLVVVDRALADDDEIIFCACTHTESIRMKFRDFERLAKPMIGDFAESAHDYVTESHSFQGNHDGYFGTNNHDHSVERDSLLGDVLSREDSSEGYGGKKESPI